MNNTHAEATQPTAAQEAVAVWTVTREGDPTFPRAYFSEAAADAMVAHITLAPFAVKRAPVAAAPVDGDFDGTSYKRMFIDACEALADVSRELDCDPERGGAEPILAAIAKLKASTPAAPGIDLATAIRNCCEAEQADPDHPDTICINVNDLTAIMQQCVIDASPKGGSTSAPRLELTNGQIAQLADFAGTPVAGTPLDEQDVLVIQHADGGHSGPGLYAHYDELPEEGAIYLDGQLPDSPKGGSDAESRFAFCAKHEAFPIRTGDGRNWIMFVATDPAYPNIRAAHVAATPEAAIDAALQATSAEVGECRCRPGRYGCAPDCPSQKPTSHGAGVSDA